MATSTSSPLDAARSVRLLALERELGLADVSADELRSLERASDRQLEGAGLGLRARAEAMVESEIVSP